MQGDADRVDDGRRRRTPIAWLYAQRRWIVPTHRIADTMKLAIVSIEDKRFAEHNGVDVQGT